MSDENRSDVDLFDSNIEDLVPLVSLKVQGLTAKSIPLICRYLPVEAHFEQKLEQWTFRAMNREFGTHKIQTVQLFAVALLIHAHFPECIMALINTPGLELSYPLRISEASQIFLQQAGFNLNVDKMDRVLSPSEMTALKEQFYRFQNQSQKRKGA